MRQRACVPLALLAALFVLACMFMAIAPLLRGTATQLRTSTSHKPHLLLKSRFHQTLQGADRLAYTATNNVTYGGGPVMAGTAYVYAIFWEPTGNVSSNYNNLIKRYFGDVGSSPLYRIMHQYTQSGSGSPVNAVLAGSWVDIQAYSKSPILDSDIQNEVTHAQKVNGWQSGMNHIFFVFTERKANICIDSTQSECASNAFCAYHSAFGSNTLYAAMPYAVSFSCDSNSGPNHDDADMTLDGTSHEQMEAASDPLGNAWIDSSGNEIGDKCERQFGSIDAQGADVIWNNDPYLVQKEWDNSTSSCRLTPATTSTPVPTNTPTPASTPTTPVPINTPTPGPTPPSDNLVSNGGFEAGNLSGWNCSSLDTLVTSPVHSGLYALQVASMYGMPGICVQTIIVQARHTYTLSAYVDGSCALLGVQGRSPTWTSSTSYTKLSIRFTTSSAQTRITIYIGGWYAQGNVYVDDVALL